MLFHEPLFLFVFFPTIYALFLAARRLHGLRGGVLLLGSVAFYAWSEPVFAALVLGSCVADWLLARRIAALPPTAAAAPALLAVGIVMNLGALVYFKYAGFLVANLDAALQGLSLGGLTVPRILLPIGVSFVVFEKITYLVDVHRRVSQPAKSLASYVMYVFFFPKLLAGPIIKYHEIDAQIRALPRPGVDDAAAGFLRFMLGLVKKVLLADTLATGADMIFDDPIPPGFSEAWWGVIFFTFQIYFDFSAYSDMAIGLARMLGFRLRENFDWPYSACSMTEFWRRWHISLSTWIREYLYLPLGGNRVAPARRYANLWVCFLASGLWHGAAWTYVLWGAWHGVFLVLDKLFLLRALNRLPRWAANAVTFAIVMLGWTLFRAGSLAQAGHFLAAMAQPNLQTASMHIYLTADMKLAAAVAAIVCILPRLPGFARAQAIGASRPGYAFAMQAALSLLFVCAVGKAVADPFKPFLYFRF